ncbi:MAG TPA: hypothetical protein VLC72_01655 [Nitrosopumilaceae archaeon]|nr:hypothetical protein [Nitrosopumilaceae archaeon]
MREKTIPVVFLILVLLIGFPSSVANFNVFADDDDEKDDKEKDDIKNEKKESKEYEKQKERAEEAREKAEQKKKELKEKYNEEIKKLQEKVKQQKEKTKEQFERELDKADEKAKQLKEKEKEKIEKELKKLEEKAKRLEEKDKDYDYDVDEFETDIDVQLSSVTGTGVTICHIPPGNPENAKTLTVGMPAAKAHMAAHGDKMIPCENIHDFDLILEELEAKFAEKKAKLEEKRAELQQKFIEKAQKLIEKFEEKQTKRTEKLLEKINSGAYDDELIDEDKTLRKFVFEFDSITPEPIGKQQETTPFSGNVTLITSSSTDTRGTAKFKVDGCNIENVEFSYKCEFGKARTTSSGSGGAKDGIVIIATLSHGEEFTAGLKLFLTSEESFNSLEIGDKIEKITMHSPQSKITHQWFLGGEGSLEVTSVNSEDDT